MMKASSAVIVTPCLMSGTAFVSADMPDPLSIDSGQISGTAGLNPEIHVYKGMPFAA